MAVVGAVAAVTGRRCTGLLSLVAVAALAMAAVAGQRHAGLADAADRQAAARASARTFAETLLTWEHDDLASSREALADLMTAGFAATYRDAMAAGLDDEIVAAEASSTVHVRHVLLGDTAGDRAVAVVVADTRVSSGEGARERTGAHLELALVRTGDGWRVDGLVDLGDVAPRDPGPAP